MNSSKITKSLVSWLIVYSWVKVVFLCGIPLDTTSLFFEEKCVPLWGWMLEDSVWVEILQTKRQHSSESLEIIQKDVI